MISARKYNIIVTFVILLVLSLITVGGYYGYHYFTDEKEEKEVVTPDIPEENNELIIETSINESIIHDDFDVTIKIPKVSNPIIDNLNDKIMDDLSDYYNDEKKYNIDYTYFVNGDIVSIVITINSNDELYYLTYNFDTVKHVIIDNNEILKYKDIKDSDYQGLLVKAYDNYLEELINKDNTGEKKKVDQKDPNYLKTIDKENFNLDRYMFLNQDNHINVIVLEYRDNKVNKIILNINTLKKVEEIKGL